MSRGAVRKVAAPATAAAPSRKRVVLKPPEQIAAVAETRKPPERRTHSERREEAERRLLDAALAIVARRGSVRMTLAEVAETAGYSRGLPAHRFGNKAGLVHALAGYIGERFDQQRRQEPVVAKGLAAILGNVHFYFSRKGGGWTSTRALLVLMSEACMEPDSQLRQELAAYNQKALDWFEQQIRIGIDQGDIDHEADPAATAVILLGVMRGVMLQWLVDDRIKLNAVRDRLLAIVEAVLRQK